MKKIALMLTLALFSSTSFAETCFKFVNEAGPSRLGNAFFAATATEVCTSKLSSLAGTESYQFVFADAEGALAIVSGTKVGNTVTLESGNVNGANVNIRGTEISLVTQENSDLNVVMGTMTIKAGRSFPQKFNLIQQN